jgi:transcription initiation factor IIE alpha subunit
MAWPLELEKWPRPWWKILASITRRARSVDQIARRVGIDAREVNQCITALVDAELINKVAKRTMNDVEQKESPRAGWRGLAMRVGQMLGFT